MKWMRLLLLVLAALFLALGLFLPIIHFEKLYFFSETPSLIELVAGLFRQGDFWLAMVVGLFSIVFPIVKLAGIGIQFSGRAGDAGFFHHALPHLSKWSMMDVMLVALVVFAAKSSGLASVRHSRVVSTPPVRSVHPIDPIGSVCD